MNVRPGRQFGIRSSSLSSGRSRPVSNGKNRRPAPTTRASCPTSTGGRFTASGKTQWDELFISIPRISKRCHCCAHAYRRRRRPTKAGTEGPFFCNRTWPFDSNKVEALKPQLTRLWPNIHAGDTVDSLWKHEWEKHG